MLKMKLLLLVLTGLLPLSQSKAQNSEGLMELKGFSIKAYYSPGHEERARVIVARCEKTILYVNGLVNFKPNVSIYILNPEHWKKFATSDPYGMPHFSDEKTLIIAAEDNPYWRSFIPPLEQLPAELASKIRKAYTNKDGNLSMMAFFDLLALHELGHAFHFQGDLTMQRLWMQELFCNIMLHTYIAENEPQNLPALEVFPEMVVAAGTAGYKFTTLTDFETVYANMDPKNYGWYQCRLHVAGKKIYDAGGKSAFINLWTALKRNKEKMTDEQFASFLSKKVHKEVADVQTKW